MASPLHSLLLISSLAAALATTAGKPSLPWFPSNKTVLIAPILADLGYFRLAVVVQSTAPFLSGPVTIFAPSDDFFRSCIVTPTCSPFRLREHVVPGLVSADHLSRLPFGSKLNTDAPGRCLTVAGSRAKIFVDGVEINRPDLYNHGRILIHGILGLVAPLSPLSCVEIPDPAVRWPEIAADPSAVLRDAAARLHHGGYSFLALAMRDKHEEMAALKKMTVFALDDSSISAGGYAYVTNVRFHVVPGGVLSHADLMRLPKGTVLPTLVPGQRLEVTHGGAAAGDSLMLPGAEFRINYVPIRAPDLVYNARIAVHGIYMPFPHL